MEIACPGQANRCSPTVFADSNWKSQFVISNSCIQLPQAIFPADSRLRSALKTALRKSLTYETLEMLRFSKQFNRELEELPSDIRTDLADAPRRLERGHRLSMPLSRPMPMVGPGVHELRLRGSSGSYRVFYCARGGDVVVLLAFCKKTQQTPFQFIKLVRRRLSEMV